MIIYVIEQRKRSLNDVTICWAAYDSNVIFRAFVFSVCLMKETLVKSIFSMAETEDKEDLLLSDDEEPSTNVNRELLSIYRVFLY